MISITHSSLHWIKHLDNSAPNQFQNELHKNIQEGEKDQSEYYTAGPKENYEERLEYEDLEEIDEAMYHNPLVQSIIQELGQFEYQENDESDTQVKEVREPIIFKNGAKYEGEWDTSTNLRDGRGMQIWSDGSVYEGHWKHDKANGRGRLVHADGDVYEGDWLDDKSHGYGVYLHSDGAKYQGDWVEDKQEGMGVETWPDNAKYEGEYTDGK